MKINLIFVLRSIMKINLIFVFCCLSFFPLFVFAGRRVPVVTGEVGEWRSTPVNAGKVEEVGEWRSTPVNAGKAESPGHMNTINGEGGDGISSTGKTGCVVVMMMNGKTVKEALVYACDHGGGAEVPTTQTGENVLLDQYYSTGKYGRFQDP